MKLDEITFCIKTIHRPWACHRLVQSLRQQFESPNIIVVDDGRPELRFSAKYPESAEHCEVINLPDHDVGVGVGRNTAVDAAQTEFIFLLDDDQIVTDDLHLDRLLPRLHAYNLDIIAVRQGNGGRPMLLSVSNDQRKIRMHLGEHRRDGATAWCDMTSNAFLARRSKISNLRWAPELKTYEHWEFFYRASHHAKLAIAVATDCRVDHNHVASKHYRPLRSRAKFLRRGLRKHGFQAIEYPGGGTFRA